MHPSLICRLYQPKEVLTGDFMTEPETHMFPLVRFPNSAAMCVTVLSLPRCDLQGLPEEAEKQNQFNRMGQESFQDTDVNGCDSKSLDACDDRSPLKKKPYKNYHHARHGKATVLKDTHSKFLPFSGHNSSLITMCNMTEKSFPKNGQLPRTLDNQLGNHVCRLETECRRCRSLSDGQRLPGVMCHLSMENKKLFCQLSPDKVGYMFV